MKFDVVIGNPPYNSGLYLDFVNTGFKILNVGSFKYVPDPVKFDHIFTDEELYRKYGLTDEEIQLIESFNKG